MEEVKDHVFSEPTYQKVLRYIPSLHHIKGNHLPCILDLVQASTHCDK